MKFRGKATCGLAVVASLVLVAAPASATTQTVASGLGGPGGLAFGKLGLYTAESEKGTVTRIDTHTGAKTPVISGLKNPDSVAFVGGNLVITTGGSEVPDAKSTGDSSVFLAVPGQPTKLLADLKKYELEHNPDGQTQFDPVTKAPLDALSNPFFVIPARGKHYVLVADAGGNDVLAIDKNGDVSTFFKPPLVTDGACAGAPNNDAQHVGCDPVPTGLAYGPNGDLYVSTLGALAPGAGRVYVLNAWTGAVKRVIKGLDAPTGIAVDSHGNVYVSEVTYGAPDPSGPPPANFDPSKVGRIVKIDRDGEQTVNQVTMPLSLTFHDGKLFATAWAIAGQVGIPNAGKVVVVELDDFK